MTEYADFSFQHLTMLPNLMGYSSVQLAGNEFTQPNDLSTYTNVVSLNISYNNLRRVWRLPPNLKILEVYNNMIEEIQCT
jgi:Leucine-rich repeat (LRR) protein